jgi:hypothetical protein
MYEDGPISWRVEDECLIRSSEPERGLDEEIGEERMSTKTIEVLMFGVWPGSPFYSSPTV